MTWKTAFLEGWSWFKFNDLGLALSTNLKFYASVAKRLKLKVRKFWELILTFAEVTEEKLVGGGFLPPSLNRVKKTHITKQNKSSLISLALMNTFNAKKISNKATLQNCLKKLSFCPLKMSWLFILQAKISIFFVCFEQVKRLTTWKLHVL